MTLIHPSPISLLQIDTFKEILQQMPFRSLCSSRRVCCLWKQQIDIVIFPILQEVFNTSSKNKNLLDNVYRERSIMSAVFTPIVYKSTPYNKISVSYKRLRCIDFNQFSLWGATEKGEVIGWDMETGKRSNVFQLKNRLSILFIKIIKDKIWLVQKEIISIIDFSGYLIKKIEQSDLGGKFLIKKTVDIQKEGFIDLTSNNLSIYDIEKGSSTTLDLSHFQFELNSVFLVKSDFLFVMDNNFIKKWSIKEKKIISEWNISLLREIKLDAQIISFVKFRIKHEWAIIHAVGNPYIGCTPFGKYWRDTSQVKSFFFAVNLNSQEVKMIASIKEEIKDDFILKKGLLACITYNNEKVKILKSLGLNNKKNSLTNVKANLTFTN